MSGSGASAEQAPVSYFVGLLTDGHSGIESDGPSLLPLNSENRVSKRGESALDDVQRM
jgi:hypothetical protein